MKVRTKGMRKKRYEFIELNGKGFTLDTKDTVHRMIIGYNDIYSVYGRPSEHKIAIWCNWERWFNDNDGNCTVYSHNCNFFTIEGYVRDSISGNLYYCYITHANNKCWLVEE